MRRGTQRAPDLELGLPPRPAHHREREQALAGASFGLNPLHQLLDLLLARWTDGGRGSPPSLPLLLEPRSPAQRDELPRHLGPHLRRHAPGPVPPVRVPGGRAPGLSGRRGPPIGSRPGLRLSRAPRERCRGEPSRATPFVFCPAFGGATGTSSPSLGARALRTLSAPGRRRAAGLSGNQFNRGKNTARHRTITPLARRGAPRRPPARPPVAAPPRARLARRRATGVTGPLTAPGGTSRGSRPPSWSPRRGGSAGGRARAPGPARGPPPWTPARRPARR